VSLDAQISLTLDQFTLEADVRVANGETLAVLGPNGAGKTTLLRALSGLLPLDGGRITVDDVVVDEPATDIFVQPEQRSVGVVFQDYLLFAHLSALDNVAFGLRRRGMRRAAARERARALLADVGMDARASAFPRELSGGQAQRVALARALAIEPALLLLDEPLAALDAQARVDTRHHLRGALEHFRGARILVTHDAIDALTLADRLCILEQGRVVQEGSADEVIEHPRSEYVAELAGVNLYRGHADGHRVHIGAEVITLADEHHGEVLAIIPPQAVVLHRKPPEGSARNTWPEVVAGVERHAGRIRVRLSGALPIVAEITTAAAVELGLTEGTQVWAAVKATEVQVQAA
jgi:molybdate transport system ATP-binding protein